MNLTVKLKLTEAERQRAIEKGWIVPSIASKSVERIQNDARNEYRHHQREANRMAGLTYDGKPRERSWIRLSGLTDDEKRKRRLKQQSNWRKRNRAKLCEKPGHNENNLRLQAVA